MTTPTEKPFTPFIMTEQDHSGYRMGGGLGGKGENHSVKPFLAKAQYWVLKEVQTPIFIYHFSKSGFDNSFH